jgi:hypothetical protein
VIGLRARGAFDQLTTLLANRARQVLLEEAHWYVVHRLVASKEETLSELHGFSWLRENLGLIHILHLTK